MKLDGRGALTSRGVKRLFLNVDKIFLIVRFLFVLLHPIDETDTTYRNRFVVAQNDIIDLVGDRAGNGY